MHSGTTGISTKQGEREGPYSYPAFLNGYGQCCLDWPLLGSGGRIGTSRSAPRRRVFPPCWLWCRSSRSFAMSPSPVRGWGWRSSSESGNNHLWASSVISDRAGAPRSGGCGYRQHNCSCLARGAVLGVPWGWLWGELVWLKTEWSFCSSCQQLEHLNYEWRDCAS